MDNRCYCPLRCCLLAKCKNCVTGERKTKICFGWKTLSAVQMSASPQQMLKGQITSWCERSSSENTPALSLPCWPVSLWATFRSSQTERWHDKLLKHQITSENVVTPVCVCVYTHRMQSKCWGGAVGKTHTGLTSPLIKNGLAFFVLTKRWKPAFKPGSGSAITDAWIAVDSCDVGGVVYSLMSLEV